VLPTLTSFPRRRVGFQKTQGVTGSPPARERQKREFPDAQTIPLGRLFGTRSGDKGGNANCGVWARTDEAYGFLYEYLTVDEFKWLCPDMAEYEVERYDMPNLRAMNCKIS